MRERNKLRVIDVIQLLLGLLLLLLLLCLMDAFLPFMALRSSQPSKAVGRFSNSSK
jgi:hypothetical protein